MLSSSPAIPLSSINFTGGDRRRLSLVTAQGHELTTSHGALPSPEHLTPIGGTPTTGSPAMSESGSQPTSRRGSAMALNESVILDDTVDNMGGQLKKVPSRGGLWHEDPVSICCSV